MNDPRGLGKMDNKELALNVLTLVGGEKNVASVTHCVTRLRFVLKNEDLADTAAIEALDGVMSVRREGGQYQVVVGTKVNKVFREVLALAPALEDGGETKASAPDGEKKGVMSRVLETLSAILLPTLPPIIGGGMLKGFLYMFWSFGMIEMGTPWWTLLDIMSNSMFYFYPFLLAVAAADRFKTNRFMALTMAGVMMAKPLLDGVAAGTESFSVGFLTIPYLDYNSSVIPIILNVWLLSYVYRFFEDHVPEIVNVILTPVFTLIVVVPIELAFIAPIGYRIGELLAMGVQWLLDFSPVVAGFVVGALRPFTVFTGTHHALRAVSAQQLATYGYSTIGAINFVSTMSQAAAPLAIYLILRSVDEKMAKISLSATVSGFLGVTEPGLYGVIVKFKAAIIAVTIGSGVGGAIAAIFGARTFGIVMPSLVTIPALIGEGFMGVVIGIPASIIVTIAIILVMRKSVLKESGVNA